MTLLITFSGREQLSALNKEREDRVRKVKEMQEEERRRKLEELKQHVRRFHSFATDFFFAEILAQGKEHHVL